MAESTNNVDEGFRRALNVHGYGFQHAVIQSITSRCPSWRIEAVEAPVVVRGQDSRIDFVLSSQSGTIVVAECKRVDPAKGRWCFARAKAQRGNAHIEVYSRDSAGRSFARPRRGFVSPRPYQIGLEVSEPGKKGDGGGSHRPSIELAVTQVFRAAAGFMNLLRDNPSLAQTGVPVVPVIFTTASLFSTETDLSSANLSDGKLQQLELTSQPWVWLEENISLSLHHELPGRWEEIADLDAHVGRGHSRTCAMVNADSVEDFLTQLAWHPVVGQP